MHKITTTQLTNPPNYAMPRHTTPHHTTPHYNSHKAGENADDQFYLKLELSTDSAVVGDNLEAICHVNKTSSSSSSPLSSSSSSLWYSSSTYLSSSTSISLVPQRQTQQKNYQVIWFKIFPESNADEIEIATNAYINDEFNHTGRLLRHGEDDEDDDG
ncbi:hypothetical protein HELRODRAFT_160583 [Helobdella robusta]|uniref:Uncharacterized protein n=1 Tax=Helobdella robusta TaxID=6412 RepID=T1EQG2_HELRO|nr:hypothetical protein HELRODRAFT_160583 [Helobdella robusta]ESO06412.1 hypothetical protein HELRODRAFT_160583 [Helobdella robusta]